VDDPRRHVLSVLWPYGPLAHIIDVQVWKAIEGIISDENVVRAEVQRVLDDGSDTMIRSDIESIRKAILETRRKIDNLAESLADASGLAVREAIRTRLAQMNAELERLEAFEGHLVARLRPYEDRERTAARFLHLVDAARDIIKLGELTLEQKRDVLEMLGVWVIVSLDRNFTLQLRSEQVGSVAAPNHACGSEPCFCKRDETLDAAIERLRALRVIA
jgi:hypothetical protein